jgi:hypothetical protein
MTWIDEAWLCKKAAGDSSKDARNAAVTGRPHVSEPMNRSMYSSDLAEVANN